MEVDYFIAHFQSVFAVFVNSWILFAYIILSFGFRPMLLRFHTNQMLELMQLLGGLLEKVILSCLGFTLNINCLFIDFAFGY